MTHHFLMMTNIKVRRAWRAALARDVIMIVTRLSVIRKKKNHGFYDFLHNLKNRTMTSTATRDFKSASLLVAKRVMTSSSRPDDVIVSTGCLRCDVIWIVRVI